MLQIKGVRVRYVERRRMCQHGAKASGEAVSISSIEVCLRHGARSSDVWLRAKNAQSPSQQCSNEIEEWYVSSTGPCLEDTPNRGAHIFVLAISIDQDISDGWPFILIMDTDIWPVLSLSLS